MVLSDRTIKEEIEKGRIVIRPLDTKNIQPASVDLRLGKKFRVFRNDRLPYIDVKKDTSEVAELVEADETTPFILHPGQFVLGVTYEHVEIPDDIVGRLDGKSSLGRLGLVVHSTAGFVDPGWKGSLTLELSNQSTLPITLYYMMKVSQISFFRTTTAVDHPYGSRELGSKYQGQEEPTPSKYHLAYERKKPNA